jgi:hypothetical protein
LSQPFRLRNLQPDDSVALDSHHGLEQMVDTKVPVGHMQIAWTHTADQLDGQRVFAGAVWPFRHSVHRTAIQVKASHQAQERPMASPMLVRGHAIVFRQFPARLQLQGTAIKQVYTVAVP